MKNNTSANRYIYHTSGVCPPEIHFKINDGKINDLRFVGGGCPGNAQLVSRLLEGKPLAHVLSDIQGIDCRNGTSCPQELACAIRAVQNGTLDIAESFKVQADSIPRQSLAVIGNPAYPPCPRNGSLALNRARRTIPDSATAEGSSTRQIDSLLCIETAYTRIAGAIPKAVMSEARRQAEEVLRSGKPLSRVGAVIVATVWLGLAGLAVWLVLRLR